MSAGRLIVAEFAEHHRLVHALRVLRTEGYTRIATYTPFPSEEIDDLLPGPPTPIGWTMFVFGVAGGCGAYFMEWYAARDFPYDVGGRPLHSWPSFVPVTFELTVLTTALTGLVALLILTRLPRLHHPVMEVPQFIRASQDRFFITIGTDDPRFAMSGLEKVLRETGAISLSEVEA